MLRILKLYRNGFNKKVTIGELVDYQSKKYIIIKILEINKRIFSESISLIVKVLVQEVGTQSEYKKYLRHTKFTKRYDQSKTNGNFFRVGQVLCDRNGIAQTIVSINAMWYEFVVLIVEYSGEIITPWSKSEIDIAVKDERISAFKVIEGGS